MTLVADVDTTPVELPAGGLISLARFPALPDQRWTSGYRYRPELPGRYVLNRSLISGERGTNLGTGEVADEIEVTPWMLEAEHKFSTFVREAEGPELATRLLEATTSRLLERELWMGEIAQADSSPNNYLKKNPTDVAGSFNPQQGVAALVGKLSDAGMGDVMIHVPRRIGVLLSDGWKNEDTVQNHGFVVVSGQGYPDEGKIYATSIVNVRLTEPEVLQGSGTDYINTQTNEITFYAQRIGAVDFAGPVFSCTVTP